MSKIVRSIEVVEWGKEKEKRDDLEKKKEMHNQIL